MPTGYPKWKYRANPTPSEAGQLQSTLVASEEAEATLDDSWTDDPHGHGIEVVPYPAEITPGGALVHHQTMPDASGNHPYGPAPTAPGIGGTVIGRVK